MDKIQKIKELKKEKDVVILAHYYVDGQVQELADHVGDSFALSKLATTVKNQNILFCGVKFMGESAKILNPTKKVLFPDAEADCAMAHMASAKKVQEMREKYEDLAVVCYINSTAALKTVSDVCVTSSNAVKIVKALPNRNIFFIPDENLGSYVSKQVPEKNILLNDGYCPVHKQITVETVRQAKAKYSQAEFLAHPECTEEILAEADFIGSTADIIHYAEKSSKQEFLIGTEDGVFAELMKKCPDKRFYSVMQGQCCVDMKKVTLEKVRDCLKEEKYEVEITEDTREKAQKALDRMLELAK